MRFYQITGDPNHSFKTGSSFSQILRLYVFDRKLRTLIFDIIEKVEISFRTQLILKLSLTRNSNWFEDNSLYKNDKIFNNTQSKIRAEFSKSSEKFIVDYKSKYSGPIPAPAWITFEVLSFGQLSRIYANLRDIKEKQDLASYYDLSKSLLISWVHSLSNLRNICGHHNRLWNRKFVFKPRSPRKPLLYWPKQKPDMNRLYGLLICLQYLNKKASPNTNFPKRLVSLLNEYSDVVDFNQMGFPPGWETDPFWN